MRQALTKPIGLELGHIEPENATLKTIKNVVNSSRLVTSILNAGAKRSDFAPGSAFCTKRCCGRSMVHHHSPVRF
ncbi:unnamed protein product [Mycena citricolor]|uniref:Uncharacterized protein n=1 Tax=Mycena citricolor TaxID=2018698 RepID=A0AAD2Q4F5_9AGAR|nr:unnamed protein product [Mycena citricolor]